MAPSTIEGLPLLDETTAERYNLSLRLHPDGITYTLSLAQDPTKVLGSDRVFFVPTAEGVEYTDRLSDLIYAYSFLPLPYHHIQIAFDASAFVLVPPGIPVREDEEAWLSIAVRSASLYSSEGASSLPIDLRLLPPAPPLALPERHSTT